ncbi:hypothetical protein [Thiohalophilus thiocyanatoxydans]|nr:hypothetical protein [Thiohalophilus thiocyanatoxydans]
MKTPHSMALHQRIHYLMLFVVPLGNGVAGIWSWLALKKVASHRLPPM